MKLLVMQTINFEQSCWETLFRKQGALTVDVSDFIKDFDKTLLFDVTFDHQVLPNQVHVGQFLAYRGTQTQ